MFYDDRIETCGEINLQKLYVLKWVTRIPQRKTKVDAISHFLVLSRREKEKINDDREIMIATTWFSFYSLFSYNTITGQKRTKNKQIVGRNTSLTIESNYSPLYFVELITEVWPLFRHINESEHLFHVMI